MINDLCMSKVFAFRRGRRLDFPNTSPNIKHRIAAIAAGGLLLLSAGNVSASPMIDWTTVVNNSYSAPGGQNGETFFSYNQPSVNDAGQVVFRARARAVGGGGGGQPLRGVFMRDMGTAGNPIVSVAQVGDTVPQPNNTGATFNEFPAFPRIDAGSNMIATRGQSNPVWQYTDATGAETRTGTSGVYTTPSGSLITGASQLGAVPGFEQFSVPGEAPGTRFDQFPGAPSPSDGKFISFKGNYAGKSGVYFRDVTNAAAPTVLIANSDTPIPGGGGVTFGSTAPPTASHNHMVFTGLDNEAAPTKGGIYMAPLTNNAPLTTLVSIGQGVPGHAAQTFNQIGEGLSFDGRYVAFWGAWGTESHSITLACPTEGNADRIAYCNQQYPNGFTTTVPDHQGIFRYDTQTGDLKLVSETGQEGFTDFLNWNFSGAAPGSNGEGDQEPARWRSAAFVALDGQRVAFKGTKADVSGIYALFGDTNPLLTLLDTSMLGSVLDPQAPDGSGILTLGIERDGFRNGFLTVNASMLNANTEAGWAGIYIAYVPEPGTVLLFVVALGLIGFARRRAFKPA